MRIKMIKKKNLNMFIIIIHSCSKNKNNYYTFNDQYNFLLKISIEIHYQRNILYIYQSLHQDKL